MANGNKNYVSIWFWMFAIFIMAIPCVGLVMIIVWSFTGDNESRKNYFRALIAWFLIFVIASLIIMSLGFWPQLQQQIQSWTHK
ncbi:MAG: hypothetical protein JWR19_68 [Pedosphaera sp.]|nr:hypothetical protein [Pedosphaera sp.]